jgi:N6-adenosine-specific RNA methylase IME4
MVNYQVIYADPPWRYDFSKSDSRQIENQYPTMELEDIKRLKFPTNENAVLFLWATSPKLIEALDVMKSWGFAYKTHLIWNKELIGMGYWCRGQHELLLIGVKGHFSPPKQEQRISSIFTQRRTNHSKKPDKIRELIAEWYPNEKKLELFARQIMEGWDVWGNDASIPPQAKASGILEATL